MTETSSLTFLATMRGDSCTRTALAVRIGCPTNSGRSCISIFSPRNPRLITIQLTNPATTGAESGWDRKLNVVPGASGLAFAFISSAAGAAEDEFAVVGAVQVVGDAAAFVGTHSLGNSKSFNDSFRLRRGMECHFVDHHDVNETQHTQHDHRFGILHCRGH